MRTALDTQSSTLSNNYINSLENIHLLIQFGNEISLGFELDSFYEKPNTMFAIRVKYDLKKISSDIL